MLTQLVAAIGEFTTALRLHYGPGPHPDGSPQQVHGGGQMAFDFDAPAPETPSDPLADVPQFRTIAEANAWAVKQRIARRCDLKGLQPATARVVLGTLRNLQREYGGTTGTLPYPGASPLTETGVGGLFQIGSINTSARGRAAARANGTELAINPWVLEKQPGTADAANRTWLAATRESIRVNADTRATFKPEQRDRIKKYDAWIAESETALAHGRWHVLLQDREVESIITHEFGHVISDQRAGLINPVLTTHPQADAVRREWNTWHAASRRAGTWRQVSAYAASSPGEGFAEAFTMYHLEPDRCPPDVARAVERVTGGRRAK